MKTNRDIERHYFEQFSKIYEFPNGAAEFADKPDVLWRGERTIGIEITNFYLQHGGSAASEQRQGPRREGVVSDAHKLHRSARGKQFELHITFKTDVPITSTRKRLLPKELAAFAASININRSGRLNPDLFDALPEIYSIYLNTKEYEDAKWRVSQVHSVELMSSTGLEEIIREKEQKAAEYLPCDAYWLLIVVNWIDPAQEQEVSVQGIKIASNVFERIVVYKPGFEDICEVWP